MTILKVFNVGHGDAMLFQSDCVFQDIPLLIDTGERKHNIYKKISNEQFDIMITHSDGDHMNGLDDLLKHKLNSIQNIYLPLYQPEIYVIFSKLHIGKTNAKSIQNGQKLMYQYMNKIIFVYDGWHSHRKKYHCNLSRCGHSKILNPPLGNFNLLNNDDSEFLKFTFEEALKHIYEENVFENFNIENYTPEQFNGQSEELINARKEYFQYVIRLIGYTISKGNWTNQSANALFRLSSNDASIILHYEIQNRFSILFTGDAGDKILKNLINQNKVGKIDILKVPHHGGVSSIGNKTLKILQPKYSILSHGNKGFGRGKVPNRQAINKLQKIGSNILATNAVTILTCIPPINQSIGLIPINSSDSIEFN